MKLVIKNGGEYNQMQKQLEKLELYSLYNIQFIVDIERVQKIERNIVCPINFSEKEIEQIIHQKFNRVKTVTRILQIRDGFKLYQQK